MDGPTDGKNLCHSHVLVSKSKAATRSLFIVYGAARARCRYHLSLLDMAALLSAPYAELSLPLSAADLAVYAIGN